MTSLAGRRRPPARLCCLTMLALGIAAAACSGGEGGPTSLRTRSGTTGGGGTGLSALVGAWTYRLVFIDSTGAALSSATTWTLAADGSAVDMLVAANLTAGIADTTTTFATWTADADTLALTFQSPATGTVRFGWSISGVAPNDTLFLNGLPFARTGS